MGGVTEHDIAAVVVLYRPDRDVVRNIATYADHVDTVFAVDNSEVPAADVLEALRELEGVRLVPMDGNRGVAAALNAGAALASEAGHSWILTMDQDSTADPGMVPALVACLTSPETGLPQDDIALVAPSCHEVGGSSTPPYSGACRDVTTVMTSGNLLRLSAWRDVGPFMEELFIDLVDYEYDLRLARHHYRLVQTGAAVLHHRLGDMHRHRFPIPAFTSDHSPLRRYYITRNRFIVTREYAHDFPCFARTEMWRLTRETIGILLYEPSKIAKLRMTWRGYRDFRRGVSGPYGGPRVGKR